jgi:multiple sugar transport system ATP-binding protein
MASVSLEGVSKVYPEGAVALTELDLWVEDHEFLVLLGPSGCGKSTTLRLIAGLEEPTSGTLRIGDRIVNDVAPKDRDIAMVFQNYALYPHMSVYRNMAFGLELRYAGGWFERVWQRLTNPNEAARKAALRTGIPARVRQTAEVLGIERLLDRMPRQLSGGERQRVALGRAMVRQPAVFLFDEPLSNLDAKLRLETRRELKQLHARLNATMIYVTHDQIEALTLGQRIAVLDQGRLQQVGTPADVYDRPCNLFVAGFIGSPPMNLLPGRLENGPLANGPLANGRLENGSQQTRSLETGRDGVGVNVSGRHLPLAPDLAASLTGGDANASSAEVVFGFRAEDVQIATAGSAAARHGSLEGRVTMTEAVGDATYVHVEIAGSSATEKNSLPVVVCKEPPRTERRVGESVELVVAPERVHLFAASSGVRLSGQGTRRAPAADRPSEDRLESP